MSSGSLSPNLGDMWRYGGPESPDWDSDIDVSTEGEEFSEDVPRNLRQVWERIPVGKHKRACRSSWSRPGNPKSFTLIICHNLTNLVKTYPGINAGSRREPLLYCCIQVWMQCYCHLRNIQDICQMGQHLTNGDSENHLVAQFFRLVRWSKSPIPAKDLSRRHQFGTKVLPSIFLGCVLYAGWNLERRH